jgi:hypothetical protein
VARMWHAAREVISSVGHPLGYPGFSEAARVCPQGRSKRALALRMLTPRGWPPEGNRATLSPHSARKEAPVTTGPGDEMAASTAGPGHLRASHADREQVIDVLKTAFVQGRLAKGEFDARVGQAFASRTYADLAAVTADLPTWLVRAQPPRQPAQAQIQPSGNTDINPAVVAMITGMTVLTAGLWAAVLIGHKIDDDGAVGMLLFLFILTFTNLGILILTGAVMRESRHQKRSGGQLPPSTPRAGGQASQRPASGASAEQLPQINPGQQHAAEAQRSRLPARNRPARGYRIDGVLGAASATL